MSRASYFDDAREHFRAGIAQFGHRWGWYLALGLVLVALGILATGMAVGTTIISVVALGWILLFAGIALTVFSFLTGNWSGFLQTLAVGLLSGITGVMLLRAPLSGAAAITLLIASFLLIAGIYRALSSLVMQFPNWGWSFLSGVVSVILGSLLISNWPNTALWFIGLYVGIDLIIHGVAWTAFSMRLRNLARGLDSTEWRHAA